RFVRGHGRERRTRLGRGHVRRSRWSGRLRRAGPRRTLGARLGPHVHDLCHGDRPGRERRHSDGVVCRPARPGEVAAVATSRLWGGSPRPFSTTHGDGQKLRNPTGAEWWTQPGMPPGETISPSPPSNSILRDPTATPPPQPGPFGPPSGLFVLRRPLTTLPSMNAV